jgi:hypothetical protein
VAWIVYPMRSKENLIFIQNSFVLLYADDTVLFSDSA